MWKASFVISLTLSILIFALLFAFSNEKQQATTDNEENRLSWSEYLPLNWSDFQAIPPGMSKRNIAAITSSVIQYRYYCEDGKIQYAIQSVFLKDESWVRETARTDDYLRHEQLHFDITEVYARKLKRFLGQRIYYCDDVREFERQINDVLAQWRALQAKYDRETQYSLDYRRQANWNDYVATLLTRYEAYKD